MGFLVTRIEYKLYVQNVINEIQKKKRNPIGGYGVQAKYGLE